MRLVVDTSVLVGELLRTQGRHRLADDRIDLYLPEQMWAETRVEIPSTHSSIRSGPRVGCRHSPASHLTEPPRRRPERRSRRNSRLLALEDEALARTPRDPTDWPVVACALALSAGVWTSDNDFLGAGVPTWTTQTLQLWLDRNLPA